MKKTPMSRVAVVAAVLSLGVLTVAAAPAVAAAAAPLELSDLPDGARLVVLPDPAAKETVIDIFFRVSQGDEGAWHGVDALLTRAWTSGSDNRSAALLQGDIARHGNDIGTSVQPDFVELWGICAPDAFERTTQTLITNLVSAPLFATSAVETARAEQLDANTLREDDLLPHVMDRLRSRAYGDSPYALPVLGSGGSLRTIPAGQVGAHYRRFFRPDRAVIVVAGPVTLDAARHIVIGCIGAGGWDDASRHSPKSLPYVAPPIPPGLRDAVVPRHAPAAYVAAGYLAPGVSGAQGRADYAALLLLDATLGGGKASRLFALRDRPATDELPIGYEIHSVLAPTSVQSFWAAYVIGAQHFASVRDRLVAALKSLADGSQPLTDAELARAKQYLKTQHAAARQTTKARAYGAGSAETLALGADFDTDYDTVIDAVSLSDVNRMARTVFGGNPAIVHTLPPQN